MDHRLAPVVGGFAARFAVEAPTVLTPSFPWPWFATTRSVAIMIALLLTPGLPSSFSTSRAGVRQSESVREFIKKNKGKHNAAGKHADILNHESDQASLLVASNLRRCISTSLIGERRAAPRALPDRARRGRWLAMCVTPALITLPLSLQVSTTGCAPERSAWLCCRPCRRSR